MKGNLTEHVDAALNDVTNIKNATAKGISYTGNGAFLSNLGVAHVDNSMFENNTADGRGGAIFHNNEGKGLTTISNSTFKGNVSSGLAGAIAIRKGDIEISNTKFLNNQADGGGAIYTYIWTPSITIRDSLFDGNKAKSVGAYGSFSSEFHKGDSNANGGTKIYNTTFSNNEATDASEGDAGAIFIGSEGNTYISQSKFINNKSAVNGGAIGSRVAMNSDGSRNNNHAYVDILDSTFEGNHADGDGGAFWNAFHDSKTNSGSLAIVNTNFSGNSATNGGAIFNDGTKDYNGKMTSIDLNGSTFKGNTALNGAGGAIYNAGKLVLRNSTFEGNKAKLGGAIASMAPEASTTGGAIASMALPGSTDTTIVLNNVTFKNNSAQDKGGALYNDKKISFTGNNVFEGNEVNGVSNDIHNAGDIAVDGTLSLDGGITGDTANKGTITFAQGSNLVVKSGTVISNNNVANQGAKLNSVFDKNFNGQYQMLGAGSSLDNEFVLSQDNMLYKIEKGNANGVYSVRKKSAEEIAAATGTSTTQAQTISALTAGSETSNALFNNLAKDINEQLQSGNTEIFATAANVAAAMAPEVAPVIQQVETENAHQVFDAVSGRLSGGVVRSAKENSAAEEKGMWNKVVAWVQTFFNTSDVENQGDVHGFDTDSHGIAMGFEQQIDSQSKLGFGYAYNNTDVDAFLRDTEVDTHNAFLYGEYKPSAWYVNGVVNYAWSEYSEDKHVLNNIVGADYDVNTLGLQVMTGYEYLYGRTVLTPEIGMRYLHVAQESYTDKLGSRVHENDSDILTSVLGAKLTQDYALENGMILRPEARVAMTYDVENGSDGAMIALANGSVYEVNGKSLDRFGVELGLGLTAAVSDNFEVTLGYEGSYRDDYENHTGMLNARYKF